MEFYYNTKTKNANDFCINKTYPFYNKDTGEINMNDQFKSPNPKHMDACEIVIEVVCCQLDGLKIACMPFVFCCCIACDADYVCDGVERGSCYGFTPIY